VRQLVIKLLNIIDAPFNHEFITVINNKSWLIM